MSDQHVVALQSAVLRAVDSAAGYIDGHVWLSQVDNLNRSGFDF